MSYVKYNFFIADFSRKQRFIYNKITNFQPFITLYIANFPCCKYLHCNVVKKYKLVVNFDST